MNEIEHNKRKIKPYLLYVVAYKILDHEQLRKVGNFTTNNLFCLPGPNLAPTEVDPSFATGFSVSKIKSQVYERLNSKGDFHPRAKILI